MPTKPIKPSLEAVLQALRESWSLETSEEPENWTASNPSRGQCGVSSLIVHDYFGGSLVLWQVFIDEVQVGFHYSNELPNGMRIDATGDQFWQSEVLKAPCTLTRPSKYPKNGADRYLILSKRVASKLQSSPC